MCACVQEGMWFRKLFGELGIYRTHAATEILGDNNGAIQTVANKFTGKRLRHIDIKHHFIAEEVESERFKLIKVPSAENLADISPNIFPAISTNGSPVASSILPFCSKRHLRLDWEVTVAATRKAVGKL